MRSRPVNASSIAFTIIRPRLRASAARSRDVGSNVKSCARWSLCRRLGMISKSNSPYFRSEDEEPTVSVERLEERLDVVARDPDALETRQRELDRLHDHPASVARQRRPESRRRLERQELRALELVQEARDDLEVELAVLQDIDRKS